MWGLIVQDFPWIIVHPALNLLVTDLRDRLASWDEPSDIMNFLSLAAKTMNKTVQNLWLRVCLLEG